MMRKRTDGKVRTLSLGESGNRLVIPAFHAEQRNVRLFKTRHHQRILSDPQEKLIMVAMSTAAAPSFFPAHQLPVGGHAIDGGIWANCPILVAVVEALTVLDWQPDDLHVLSLGCTEDVFDIPIEGGKWEVIF